MLQHFEDSVTISGPDSLKNFIKRNFDQIDKERKRRAPPKKKKKNDRDKPKAEDKDEDEDEEEKQTKKTSINNLLRFTSMLLQYVAAFIKKSRLDFTNFRPSCSLGPVLLDHLKHSSAIGKMVSKIDEREDEKGHMILIR